MDALSGAGVARLRDVMSGYVERGDVPGLVWLVSRRGEVHTGWAGGMQADSSDPVARDFIVRVTSMTKPVTAVAALLLIEECKLRLDEPVDRLLPELADRQVLADVHGSLDDTVPAKRPISVRDLLTFRMGLGGDFTGTIPQPVMEAMGKLELGVGPPAPAGPPEPDEWMRRLGSLPLEYQPGERWLYHTGADVLGVLIARASGQPFETFLAERIFEPLGMVDTGFWVPASKMDRFGPCFWKDPETGERAVYDPPDGQWSKPPAFPGGGAGLVSTVDDWLAFSEMLLAGGTYRGTRLLSRPTVEAMTTNYLTPEQLTTSSPDTSGAVGWGFGVGTQLRRRGPTLSPGSYWWDGGMGSTWSNDPAEDLIGIMLANQAWESPIPPPVFQDFWTCAYGAIND
ncbi:MAG TPA: serine hydrolase domain-containing protein [Acidimicrobiales bacterium]|jgi:CubicO group peptidase (beta-lactamase class C family)